MPEDTNAFLEKAFQNLTGVREVNFDKCKGSYGWAAESRGISTDDSDVGYFVSLMKRWGPGDNTRKMREESNYHQYKATGNIDSLKFMTQTPTSDKQTEAKVITRLNYLSVNKIETIKERIEDAIKTQRAAKKLLSEKEEEMRRMLDVSISLSHYSVHSISYGDEEFGLIYDRRGEPLIRLLNSENGFVASTQNVAHLPLIVKPLKFQLERFEKLI